MAEQAPPIIVVKKVKGGHGHHGGAWKVAYADFVTAMMALFIVLWLMSSSEKVKKAVGGYFMDPSGNGNLAGSNMSGSGPAVAVAPNDMDQLKDKIEQAMRAMPDFQRIRDNVQITITADGLRIELIETEKGMFFESGNATPLDRGADLLKRLAKEVGALPNKVAVEGHTDAKPYTSATGYSNWELSADRGNAARRLMQSNGLRADQVSQVRGFADQQLKNPQDPFDPSNRRVSLIIQYLTPPPGSPAPAAAEGKKGEPAAPAPAGEHKAEAKPETKPAAQQSSGHH